MRKYAIKRLAKLGGKKEKLMSIFHYKKCYQTPPISFCKVLYKLEGNDFDSRPAISWL